jgi:hypothetical protein
MQTIPGIPPFRPFKVFFTNKNINATNGSRTAIIANPTNASVRAALLGATLILDPFQFESTLQRGMCYTRPQSSYVGNHKVFVKAVETVFSDGSAICEVVEACADCKVQVASGIDLTAGSTQLYVTDGSFALTTVTQRSDSLANLAADLNTRLLSGTALSLETIASGSNTAVTLRRVSFGSIGGLISAA